MTTTTDKQQDLERIGRNAYVAISELVAALDCDYDRLADLQELAKDGTITPEEQEERDDLIAVAGDCESVEDARERIEEDALEVEVCSAWHTPGNNDTGPAVYRVLLTTGGPAVRITGDLNLYGEPETATLEAQDWFTPWTECGAEEGVLLSYVGCFYFGE